MESHNDCIGLLLSDDLMFTSRIAGTARDLGLTLKSVRSASQLLAARQQPVCCVILDLSNETLNIGETVPQLRNQEPRPYVVGYGSHVDAATLKAARDAGCDLVLPRSKFVEELPISMPSWFAAGSS
jgi:DNA-binding NarL/FixJ family response regulator